MKRYILSIVFLLLLPQLMQANSLYLQYNASELSERAPRIFGTGLFVNDTFFDGEDRWRSGSYQRSWFMDQGRYELRLRSEYITPQTLVHPHKEMDRPYAAILQLGAFRHFDVQDHDLSLGATVSFVNQIETMQIFQKQIHSETGFSDFEMENFYLEDDALLSLEAEWRRDFRVESGYFVPFMEVQIGERNRATLGYDWIITNREYQWFNRDQTTGHLLGELRVDPLGKIFSLDLVLGGDITWLCHDYYLQAAPSQVEMKNLRYRVRAGMRVKFDKAMLFLGPTYLSEEFVGQKEGQMVQAISLDFTF